MFVGKLNSAIIRKEDTQFFMFKIILDSKIKMLPDSKPLLLRVTISVNILTFDQNHKHNTASVKK